MPKWNRRRAPLGARELATPDGEVDDEDEDEVGLVALAPDDLRTAEALD